MWRAYQLLWNKRSYIPRNVKEELFHTFNTWCFKSQKKKKKKTSSFNMVPLA